MRAFLTGFTVFPQAKIGAREARGGAIEGGEASSEQSSDESRGKNAEWHGNFVHWPAAQIFGAPESAPAIGRPDREKKQISTEMVRRSLWKSC
jgi:hypothetical protein